MVSYPRQKQAMQPETLPTLRRPLVGADHRPHLVRGPIVVGQGLGGAAGALSP
jgi:hypothetical protein